MRDADDRVAAAAMRMLAADEGVVREVIERLRETYEALINERGESGKSTRFVDFLMGVHNFHKFVVLDVAEREEAYTDPRLRVPFLRVWSRTFSEAIEREVAKVRAVAEAEA